MLTSLSNVVFGKIKRLLVIQNGLRFYSLEKSGVIRTILQYNNLPLVYNKNLRRYPSGLWFSRESAYRFHISYSTDRGRNHCTYDPTRMRKWSNSFISSTILSSSADLAFHKIYAFSCTLRDIF